jgi:DNA-binding NarL/FixJ family response regulator
VSTLSYIGALQLIGCHLEGGVMAKRILIVDDSILIRRLIRTHLEDHSDFEVCGEAAHGEEAVKRAPELQPDLIVLDFSMPRMNGLEVAQALQPILPTTPKIMLTAHKDTIPEQLARSVGITAVLSKSDGMEVLMAEIRRLLNVTQVSAASSRPS